MEWVALLVQKGIEGRGKLGWVMHETGGTQTLANVLLLASYGKIHESMSEQEVTGNKYMAQELIFFPADPQRIG
jgi:hypothetical protein